MKPFSALMAWLCALVAALLLNHSSYGATDTPARSQPLSEILANLKVPPDWMAATPITWDVNKPWKDARLEIRRLLALDDASVRQGAKLTWLYAQKGDIGDGHELPMYMFMSGNYAWAAREYPPYLARQRGKGATHGFQCYASVLAHFGEYTKALEVLDEAMKDLPPEPWRISNIAKLEEHYGDLRAAMGDLAKAKAHYAEAIKLLPTSNQPYGRHLLGRQAGKIQAKLDLLMLQNLNLAVLKPGTFTAKTLGYAETPEMEVSLTLQGGKITDVKVKHAEKIDLNATTLIPKRIVEKQSLKVDAITGATVTSQAIVDGAFRALKKAGLN